VPPGQRLPWQPVTQVTPEVCVQVCGFFAHDPLQAVTHVAVAVHSGALPQPLAQEATQVALAAQRSVAPVQLAQLVTQVAVAGQR